MIDTVILKIPNEHLSGYFDQHFGGRWILNSRNSNYEKYIVNPNYSKSRIGVYTPRLTFFKRRVLSPTSLVSFLKIEFSVPKLLFGNNLEEVEDSDVYRIIELLREYLADLNISVDGKHLASASVAAAHFSKNIIITDGYTATGIIKELAKVNLNKKFDFNKTDFRNNGTSLQCYTAAHSLVFYDKIADLAQDKRRAIDKDQSPNRLSILSKIKQKQSFPEILRIEVRLSQKRKLNSVMAKISHIENPIFEEIIKKDLCQKVVSFYWETIIRDENLFLFELSSRGPKEYLKELVRAHQRLKAQRLIYLVGLRMLCKDEGGTRDLRDFLSKRISQRSWYRIATDIKQLNRSAVGKKYHGWVTEINNALSGFNPISIATEK